MMMLASEFADQAPLPPPCFHQAMRRGRHATGDPRCDMATPIAPMRPEKNHQTESS